MNCDLRIYKYDFIGVSGVEASNLFLPKRSQMVLTAQETLDLVLTSESSMCSQCHVMSCHNLFPAISQVAVGSEKPLTVEYMPGEASGLPGYRLQTGPCFTHMP